MLVAALTDQDRRQLALALDLLARRLRADGLKPTSTLGTMRETLAATDSTRQGPTNEHELRESSDTGPVLYDLDECAHRARLSRRTLERAARDGSLKVTKFGRAVRIHPDDLEFFVRSHGPGRAAVAIEPPGPTTGAA
jgi:excisionase family DNA binding protein